MRPRLGKQKFNRLIADDLRSRILAGVFPIGSLLPTEAALAAEYGTNRNTLREAIRILETQGFLAARQGEGVRVVDFKQRPSIELIGYLLAQPQPTADLARIVFDLLALRKLLAGEIVRMAAGNISKPVAVEIRKLLKAIGKKNLPESERIATDRRILELLVQSTGSLVYSALFHSIYRVVAEGAAQTPSLTALPQDYSEQMGAILDCLLAGNSVGATESMRDLCDASDAVLLNSYLETMANRR